MPTKKTKTKIQIKDNQVHVKEMVLTAPEIASYLRRLPDEKRPSALADATRVGVFCLERVANFRDVDFVRQLLEQQTRAVATELEKLPGKVEAALTKQLGSKKGQVLAPIVSTVSSTERVLKGRLSDVQKLLNGQLDPRRRDSTLGRAITTITNMLDPKHDDSVQRVLEDAVDEVASADGALATVFQKILNAELKTLREEVNRLGKEIRGHEAAADALASTTAKGISFEEELRSTVQFWGRMTGAAVDQVGPDRKPGDVLVTINDGSLSQGEFKIVIEARNETSPRGKKRITESMDRAMRARGAGYGIYIAKTPAGLAREIADWSEGRCSQGPFLATTSSNLLTALRFAVSDARLKWLASARPEADLSSIRGELNRIRISLRRIRTVKVKTASVHKNMDAISQEVEELQREIADALLAMENALQGATDVAA